MARHRKAAHVMKWRGHWYLVYTDYFTGKQKRVSCNSLKAFTAETRKDLEQDYRSRELLDSADVLKYGGRVAFDALLCTEIDNYLAEVERRAQARAENPDNRAGLAPASASALNDSANRFKTWLIERGKSSLATSDLDSPTIARFFDDLAAKRVAGRAASVATINHHKRNIRACLGFINALRPRRFADFEALLPALKPLRGVIAPRAAFSPEQFVLFLKTAIEHDNPGRVLSISRTKFGQQERYLQAVPRIAATPVSRLVVLLALTGMRLGEALNLRWEHVDLNRGRLTIFAPKTGMTRILPLVNAPEGTVSPGLLDLLRRWKVEAGSRQFVLPHEGLKLPVFPKSAWRAVLVDAELQRERFCPQALRQNFTSYAASIGIPAAVCALWQGHSAAIAERYYRTQVLDRCPGKSIEEALGLVETLRSWRRDKSANSISLENGPVAMGA